MSFYKEDEQNSKTTLDNLKKEHNYINDTESNEKTTFFIQQIQSFPDLTDPNLCQLFSDLAELCRDENYNPDPSIFLDSNLVNDIISILGELPIGIFSSTLSLLDFMSNYDEISKHLVENKVHEFCVSLMNNEELPLPILIHVFNLLSSLIPFMSDEDIVSIPLQLPTMIENMNDALPVYHSLIAFQNETIKEMIPSIIELIVTHIDISKDTPGMFCTLANILNNALIADSSNLIYVISPIDGGDSLFSLVFKNTGFNDLNQKIILLKAISCGCSLEERDGDFIEFVKSEVTLDWIFSCVIFSRSDEQIEAEQGQEDEEEDDYDEESISENEAEEVANVMLASLYVLKRLVSKEEFRDSFIEYIRPHDVTQLIELYEELPYKGREDLMHILFSLFNFISNEEILRAALDAELVDIVTDFSQVSSKMAAKMSVFAYILMKRCESVGIAEEFLDNLDSLDFFESINSMEFDDPQSEEDVQRVFKYFDSKRSE